MSVLNARTEYNDALVDWIRLRDFYAGERAVKAKGKLYLPELDGHSPGQYERYRRRTVFFNATRRTVDGLTGAVFRKPPRVKLGPGNEDLEKPLKTVTLDGQSLDVLIRRVVEEVILMGRIALQVDIAGSGNPYIAQYPAETIRNWRTAVNPRTGINELNQVILKETVEVPSVTGFGVDEEERLRALTVDENGLRVDTFETRNGNVVDMVAPTRRGRPIDFIPFVFIGPDDLTPEIQPSPMQDIVDLNAHHYMQSADLCHGRHHAAMPTYYVRGAMDREGIAQYKVGPENVWLLDVDGGAGILEFNGHGLSFLENATADIERQMAVLGARLLSPPRKTASESEGATTLRSRGEQATLFDIVATCERGIEEVLRMWLWWQGRESDGVTVELNRDFADLPVDDRMAYNIMRLWQGGLLPRDAAWEALYRGEILPERFNPERLQSMLGQDDQWMKPKEEIQEELHERDMEAQDDINSDEGQTGSVLGRRDRTGMFV